MFKLMLHKQASEPSTSVWFLMPKSVVMYIFHALMLHENQAAVEAAVEAGMMGCVGLLL